MFAFFSAIFSICIGAIGWLLHTKQLNVALIKQLQVQLEEKEKQKRKSEKATIESAETKQLSIELLNAANREKQQIAAQKAKAEQQLKTQNSDLQRALRAKEKQLETILTEKNEELTRALLELKTANESQMAAKEAEIRELKRAKEAEEAKRAEISAALTKIEKEKEMQVSKEQQESAREDALSELVATRESEIKALQERNEQTEEKVKELSKRLKEREAEENAFRKNIADKAIEIEQLKQENRKIQQERESEAKENESLKRQLSNNDSNEREQGLRNEIAKKTLEIANLKQANEQIQQEKESKETENDKLKSQLSGKEKRDEEKVLRDEIASKTLAIEKLQNENEAIKQAHESKEKDNAKLADQLSLKESELRETQKELALLKNAADSNYYDIDDRRDNDEEEDDDDDSKESSDVDMSEVSVSDSSEDNTVSLVVPAAADMRRSASVDSLPRRLSTSQTVSVSDQVSSKLMADDSVTPRSADEALRKRRSMIVREFLDTEQHYGETLRLLTHTYLYPMLESRILPQESVAKIFLNVEVLLFHANDLLQMLQATVERQGEYDAKIGNIFVFMANALRCYVYYTNGYDEAVSIVKMQCKKNKKFKEFIDQRTNRHDVYDYMIVPVQRLPRYAMLLSELLRFTPAEHADHEPLMQAQTDIGELLNFINNSMLGSMRMRELSGTLLNWTSFPTAIGRLCATDDISDSAVCKFLHPCRRLVKEGNVLDAEHKSRECLLFNDSVLLCKQKGKKSKVKKLIVLTSQSRVVIPDSPTDLFVNDEIIRFKSKSERTKWAHELTKVIDEQSDLERVATQQTTVIK